ncbi:MFS transporter [Nesterenkonia halophila]
MAFCASGGKFCDGWILGVIGVALPLASSGLGMDSTWEGLIGSASLVGLFLGGLLLGWVTDKVGRRVMFLATLLTFLICSALQFLTTDPAQLVMLRLIMGIAVGADYAIAGSLIAEFTSKQRRGTNLARMIVWWYAGFSVSATLALLFMSYGPDVADLWRWILASSAMPALVMLIARVGFPESPRWLVSKGRTDEADRIAARFLTSELKEDIHKEDSAPATYATLFSPQYIRRTALTSIFWMAQVTPFFAIYTFLPDVLDGLHLALDANWGEVVLYAFLFVGSFIGASLVNRIGRRRLLIWPFVGSAATLMVLGLWPDAPSAVVAACFMVFALLNSGSGVLQMLYPSEIFPTDIRATGIGFAAAMSRIGAAAGTFLLPLGLAAWGVGPVMLLSSGMLLVGLLVSVLWAPETANQELSQATASHPTVPTRREAPTATEGTIRV